jgi:hypothetical protein
MAIAALRAPCLADEEHGNPLWNSYYSCDFFDDAGIFRGQSYANTAGGYDYFDSQAMFVGRSRLLTRDRIDYFDMSGNAVKSITDDAMGHAIGNAPYSTIYIKSLQTTVTGINFLDSLDLDE